ncbi:uncharacterized protein LOC106182089 [Lingula anatina]|uniref:Uncharacterized protein LOC106182089 n=1 Tax=Lingula anatina TaxID=7574 RepID=A0A1S3KHT2_LINAN|nr:uncharacterized protein LOC106182089 [Lingula anatina]|eukprot:XP_013422188.1 uncharacterized protein LOC106182089 [Lingula anatina]
MLRQEKSDSCRGCKLLTKKQDHGNTTKTFYGKIAQFWDDYQYILSIAIPVCVGTLLAVVVLTCCMCCRNCRKKNRRGKKKPNNSKKFHELKNMDRVMLLADSSDDEI